MKTLMESITNARRTEIDAEIVASPELQKLSSETSELSEKLLELLKDIPEAKKLYFQLEEKQNELMSDAENLHYQAGFKDGLNLMSILKD